VNSKIESAIYHPVAQRHSKPGANLSSALTDLAEGLSAVHIWLALGWQEVKQRYRRSMIGPFWLTISTGLMLIVMGPLYGKLFNQDINSYFLYLAVSFVVWQLFSAYVSDACGAFIGAEGFIKQVRLPLTVYVLRLIWKNLIMFFHNLIFLALVLAYFQPPLGFDLLLVPVGLLLFALNALWVGLVLGLVSARFRDIPQIVGNVVQILFFLTPVLWQPGMLGRHAWVVNLNPFYHFLEMIRTPLIGAPVNTISWAAVVGMSFVGFAIMLPFFARFRARVAYWL
jgi:ABC-2 type transport system permease protein/lipopolysaccharide transport system permease protein